MPMNIESPAFRDGKAIPVKYTFDGENVSPPLVWDGAPPETKEFALICDDPDAPRGTWTHWVIYGISAGITGLPEGVPKEDTVKGDINQGLNSGNRVGYDGPSPPAGRPHRYFFMVFALDIELNLHPRATKEDLTEAMKGHILAEARTHGTYQRRY